MTKAYAMHSRGVASEQREVEADPRTSGAAQEAVFPCHSNVDAEKSRIGRASTAGPGGAFIECRLGTNTLSIGPVGGACLDPAHMSIILPA